MDFQGSLHAIVREYVACLLSDSSHLSNFISLNFSSTTKCHTVSERATKTDDQCLCAAAARSEGKVKLIEQNCCSLSARLSDPTHQWARPGPAQTVGKNSQFQFYRHRRGKYIIKMKLSFYFIFSFFHYPRQHNKKKIEEEKFPFFLRWLRQRQRLYPQRVRSSIGWWLEIRGVEEVENWREYKYVSYTGNIDSLMLS